MDKWPQRRSKSTSRNSSCHLKIPLSLLLLVATSIVSPSPSQAFSSRGVTTHTCSWVSATKLLSQSHIHILFIHCETADSSRSPVDQSIRLLLTPTSKSSPGETVRLINCLSQHLLPHPPDLTFISGEGGLLGHGNEES